MKNELNEKLVEILTSIQNATGKAADFALTQLPDIAQSYVAYGRIVTVAQTLLMLFIGIVLFCIFAYAYKNPWNNSEWSWDKGKKRDDGNVILMIISGALGSVITIAAISSFNWLVWIAPKVWLIKELSLLIK